MTDKKRTKEWSRRWWFPHLEFDHLSIAYLPDKDRNGNRLTVGKWETKALKLQGKLFGGATSWPSRGSYRLIGREGKISTRVMLESTRMITSFIAQKDFTEEALKEVTGLLKDFGRQTNQEIVAFVVDENLHYIPIEL